MVRLDETIDRITRSVILETKYKKTLINRLYRSVEDLTRHIYRDDNWAAIDEVVSRIESLGCELSVYVEDGGYRNSMGGNTMFAGGDDVSYWKEWRMNIIEPESKFEIEGVIKAHAAGTREDPFERYDITVSFW